MKEIGLILANADEQMFSQQLVLHSDVFKAMPKAIYNISCCVIIFEFLSPAAALSFFIMASDSCVSSPPEC